MELPFYYQDEAATICFFGEVRQHDRVGSVVGMAVLGLALLVGTGVSQNVKRPSASLPSGWSKLGLSKEQKEKVYSVRRDYRTKIAALEKQIEELRVEERGKMFAVLTADQKEKARKLLTGEGRPRQQERSHSAKTEVVLGAPLDVPKEPGFRRSRVSFLGDRPMSGERERIPWWGMAILGGLLAWWLEGKILSHLGIVLAATGHIPAEPDAPANPGLVWGIRVGLALPGFVVGSLLCRPVNRALKWLFRFSRRTEKTEAVPSGDGKPMPPVAYAPGSPALENHEQRSGS